MNNRPCLISNKVAGVADQGVSSVQNFTLLVIVARGADSTGFGVFSVVMAASVLAVTLSRAILGETLLITLTAGAVNSRRIAGAGIAVAAIVGVALGMLVCGVSLILPQRLSIPFFVLGCVLPPLLLLDVTRYLLFRQERSAGALMVDLAWTAGWVGSLTFSGGWSEGEYIASWGGTALIGAAVGCGLLQPCGWFDAVPCMARDVWRTSASLLVEWFFLNASRQVTVFALAGVAGLASTGALRAAEGIYGPVSTIINAIRVVFIPEMARNGQAGAFVRAGRLMVHIGVACAGVAGFVTIGVLAIPDTMGRSLYGSTWALAVPLMLPVGLSRILSSVAVGPYTYLRGMGLVRWSVFSMVAGTVLEAVLVITASSMDIRLAAFGMVVAASVLLVLMSIPAFRSLKAHDALFFGRGATRPARADGNTPYGDRTVADGLFAAAAWSSDEREPPRHRRWASYAGMAGRQDSGAISHSASEPQRPRHRKDRTRGIDDKP
jgi:O-antigen/teichoic acid export membrane protein